MLGYRLSHFVRLHPRADTVYCSQGRTVFATGLDGFVVDRPDQGLFSNQTRLLNKYRYCINEDNWWPVAVSNIEQHSWMGYYIQAPPGYKDSELDRGSGQVEAISQRSSELRLSRFVGEGVHEDVDCTNFAGREVDFELRLELDGDFLDQEETHREHKPRGTFTRDCGIDPVLPYGRRSQRLPRARVNGEAARFARGEPVVGAAQLGWQHRELYQELLARALDGEC